MTDAPSLLTPLKAALGRVPLLRRGLGEYRTLRAILSATAWDLEKTRLFRSVRGHTMVSPERLNNVFELCREAEVTGLPGAFVECGVWKGGCAAVMAYVMRRFPSGRRLWLFDSFQGLPQPTSRDGPNASTFASDRAQGVLEPIDQCIASLGEVEDLLFRGIGIHRSRVEVVEGWFQQTLPVHGPRLGPIAVLRLDGDWYESTMVCLEILFDQVVSRGFVVVDDYGHWEGCREAVDEFLGRRGLSPRLWEIDYTGRYFRKA